MGFRKLTILLIIFISGCATEGPVTYNNLPRQAQTSVLLITDGEFNTKAKAQEIMYMLNFSDAEILERAEMVLVVCNGSDVFGSPLSQSYESVDDIESDCKNTKSYLSDSIDVYLYNFYERYSTNYDRSYGMTTQEAIDNFIRCRSINTDGNKRCELYANSNEKEKWIDSLTFTQSEYMRFNQ